MVLSCTDAPTRSNSANVDSRFTLIAGVSLPEMIDGEDMSSAVVQQSFGLHFSNNNDSAEA